METDARDDEEGSLSGKMKSRASNDVEANVTLTKSGPGTNDEGSVHGQLTGSADEKHDCGQLKESDEKIDRDRLRANGVGS